MAEDAGALYFVLRYIGEERKFSNLGQQLPVPSWFVTERG